MIEPAMRTDAACTQCHHSIESAEQVRKHTQHPPGTTTCYDCHMPKVVYGVMTLHPTHLIANPDPGSTVLFNKPNACNLCHLDKSVNWAVRETNLRWNKNLPAGDASFDSPEIVRGLLSGDAVYRTVLLEHARTRKLRGYEALYRKALDDPFFTVSRSASDALELRYGRSFATPVEWLEYLATQNIPHVEGLESISFDNRNEETFEFGE